MTVLEKYRAILNSQGMNSMEISTLKTVAYFDVFSYPLTIAEIIFFNDQVINEEQLLPVVENLVNTHQLWKFNQFYSVRNEPVLAKRRIKGNKYAEKEMKKVKRVAAFLSWIPFITGIAVSGSLSKNYADEDSDFDFFIINAPNRLWIVRIIFSLLIKIAKAIRVDDWFCLNYFIDELNPPIQERNIYTAVEIATLLPLKGSVVMDNFFKTNNWIRNYLPNYQVNLTYINDNKKPVVRRIGEWFINLKNADKLNDKLCEIFRKRFEKQVTQNVLNKKGFKIGYEATRHACKSMPQFYQPFVLTKFQDAFERVKEKYCKEVMKEIIAQ